MIPVLTTLFNPYDDKRITAAYWKFRSNLPHSVKLITLEACFDTRQVPDSRLFKATSKNIAWQKERLINWYVENSNHEAYIWVDADSIFANPLWYESTLHALDYAPTVQLFEYHVEIDAFGSIGPKVPSYAFLRRLEGHGNCKPGGAWAARREVFPLFDRSPLGGADKLQTLAWSGEYDDPFALTLNLDWRRQFLTYAAGKKAESLNIPGDLIHFYHGSYKQYTSRNSLLADFKPKDLTVNELLEWTNPAMQQVAEDYFKARANG